MSEKTLDILDCTIRDGSYVIDGQWTAEDVRDITSGLAEMGFRYIEIGNGIGMGATRKGVRSILTDEQFAAIAVSVKKNAGVGFFFIPGVGTLEDIRLAAEWGCDFIRIGTDVSKSNTAVEYIEFAKKVGLEVGYNFMKSYAVTPYELCKRAMTIEQAGADVISLVDSAGGMLPAEVGHYIEMMHSGLKTRIGFHGHNNLLLANANNIAAIENGASVVDTTLMGMGRGAGNAQTESMLVILEKMGKSCGIDPLKVARLSTQYIHNRSNELKGSDDLQLVMGYAQFHDSYLHVINEMAEKYAVDYRTLIMEVSKINKENPTADLIESVAQSIKSMANAGVYYPKTYQNKS